MSDSKLSKAQLRNELRQRRQALGPAEQLAAAKAAAAFILQLPDWPGARRIALYLAADGEIDTGELAQLARSQDKQLFLPVIERDNHLSFAAWLPGSHLAANRYGIPEPSGDAKRCATNTLDIIFLPLVGWDLHGGRLGMGGGFYDRTLAGTSGPVLVGLAHGNQQVDRIPREDWDIPLDFIATDTALYCCQGAN